MGGLYSGGLYSEVYGRLIGNAFLNVLFLFLRPKLMVR